VALAFQPQYTDGAGNCPIEGCDGPEGYTQLELLLASTGPHRGDRIQRLLGYDLDEAFNPGEFTAASANARLQPATL
jgi:hypothetical protein